MFNAPSKPAISYIIPANVKVTVCPPALAKGSEATSVLKDHVAKVRKVWRDEHAAPKSNE